MPDHGLLTPGIGADDPDDLRLLRAMLRAEVAWAAALEEAGIASPGSAQAIGSASAALAADDGAASALAARLAAGAAATGNPVIGLVDALRAAVPSDHRDAVHAALTSQDVLDTALVLVLVDAADAVHASLTAARASLAGLALEHRSTPALAHTLSQAALPTTLGARVAGWLQAVAEADHRLMREADSLPVAFGGAVGTLAHLSDRGGALEPAVEAMTVVEAWAGRLGRPLTAAPWHVTRFPVERAAGALAEVCAAAGKIAADVLMGSRPESGELREHAAPGKGGSSAMPFKANPVLSVTMRRSALAAPHLLAQVHAAAGLAVDERPDGAWHAEWAALRELARHAVIASRSAAELAEGLRVDPAAAGRNLEAHGPGGADGVGEAEQMVDRVIAQYGYRG